MKIKDEVLSPYEIWQDSYNFSVGVPYTNPKTGDINLNNSSHFTTLSSALLHIVKLKMVKDGEILNLNQYIKAYESVKTEILDTIKL